MDILAIHLAFINGLTTLGYNVKNPFAYFTQITYYAFLRRIAKEKRQQQTKYRYMRNIDVHDLITQDHDTGDYGNEFIDYVKKQMDMIDDFDKPEAAKVEVDVKYVGFDIPKDFVIGYGLDFDEKYRNLPFIAVLAKHMYE